MIVNGKEVVWSEAVEELLVKDELFCEEVTQMLHKFKNGKYEYSGCNCAFDKHQYKQYNLNHPNRPIGSYRSYLYNEEVQIREKIDHIVIYFPFEN